LENLLLPFSPTPSTKPGQLQFSTDSGDAWLLDPSEQLAVRLARDGDPEPVHLEETDGNFTVTWTGHYRIGGAAFIYSDGASGRVVTIVGYPTDRIAQLG
jgi:hypothetical protein